MIGPPFVIGITPLGQTAPRLVAALCRAGALGVLDAGDAGRDATAIQQAVVATALAVRQGFGVCFPDADALDPAALPSNVVAILLSKPSVLKALPHQRVFVQVTSELEAAEAVKAGAFGLIAK